MTDAALFQNQYRITRLQVFNWGTFSNIHDIPISESGFLFVGASGSGKSTLLDAMVTLLFPNPNYNAAAREGEQRRGDRSILTYVRGAWSTKTESEGLGSQRVKTQYLRQGATFSAIALTFSDRTGDQKQLMLVAAIKKSANEETGVNRRYYVLDGEYRFQAKDFEGFAHSGFDWRWLKGRLPAGRVFERFAAYNDAFCELFSIRDKTALKLLAKAQSAKNLGDLNSFLRNFMLEAPQTFSMAEKLVEEFNDLNDAHQSVVTAREQTEILRRARDAWTKREEALSCMASLELEKRSVPRWRLETKLGLLTADLPTFVRRKDETEKLLLAARRKEDDAQETLEGLKRRHWLSGGEQISLLKKERVRAEERLEECLSRRNKAAIHLEKFGTPMPTSNKGWIALVADLKTFVNEAQERSERRRAERDDRIARKRDLSKDFEETAAEIRAMRERPSNIPSKILALRSRLAAALELPEDALPFVGELLQVKKEEARWQGAIERVLHNFALSILVADEHYKAFSNHVDEATLGERLVYFRVKTPVKDLPDTFRPGTIPTKLELASGPWRAWLEKELDERFSYFCAETMEDFRRFKTAVTLRGQVKHSEVRHEKDDRHAVNDRRRWVTGFSNADKLALFEEHARAVAGEIEKIDAEVRRLEKEAQEEAVKEAAAQTVLNCEWHEIDAEDAKAKLRTIETNLNALLEQNEDLKALEEEIVKAEGECKRRREITVKQNTAFETARATLAERQKAIETCRGELQGVVADPTVLDEASLAKVAERAGRYEGGVSLSTLESCVKSIEMQILNANALAEKTAALSLADALGEFGSFLEKWPAYKAILAPNEEAAGEFFEKLDELERDGLPAHEERFRKLLADQSFEHVVHLQQEILRARKEILSRMEVVNASLEMAPFSRLAEGESHLKIEVKNVQRQDITDFRNELSGLLQGAWDDLSSEGAEARFSQIKKLVERLDPTNSDAEVQRWRKLVLDVRQHVEFTAYELDEAGNVIETYLSGSGKSGGQRQKLTTTCLAAALRYQLGNSEEGLPVFAPVILDEAFDKADSDFTDLSMNIFRRFGFQMIVATPEKSIVTLEPYIGGAFYVVMKDRMHSSGLSVRYDEETQKLDFEHMNDLVEEPESAREPKSDVQSSKPERAPKEPRTKVEETPVPGLFDELSLFE